MYRNYVASRQFLKKMNIGKFKNQMPVSLIKHLMLKIFTSSIQFVLNLQKI